MVQTLREYCKNENREPRAFLTGDPNNKQFLETKVLELIQDIKLKPSMKTNIKVLKDSNNSRFGQISLCAGDVIQDNEKMDLQDHLQISFVDFAGHSEYVSCSTLFMKETGIFLICFDAQKIPEISTDDWYFPSIGTYFELVTDCCPVPIFVLVATKMDLCQATGLDTKLAQILDAARQHLRSISKRSQRIKSVFLFDEIISTSSAKITKPTLDCLSSKLVAICGHKDLLDVKLVTIPTVWRRMIEKAKTHLKVSIDDLVQDYTRVVMKHGDEAVTEEMIALGGWEGVIKKSRERARNQETQPTLQFSEGPTIQATDLRQSVGKRTESKDQIPIKSNEDAKAPTPVFSQTQEENLEENVTSTDLKQKVETILSVLSTNNEIFWFRLILKIN